ncbi:MAG: 50S ribosomal protein L13 [Candidatus Yanofskybacteria bacterium]|nr:50S ribosomal protein L13 [Candidatus Yanofskybacteria bacterium]
MKTHTVDATNQSLGRLSTKVATLLRGKDSASYEPNKLPEVEVVIENIDKIRFAGTKAETKVYYRYSGYPGGMHSRTLEQRWAKHPKEVVRESIYGMLPKNKLRSRMIKNLKFN